MNKFVQICSNLLQQITNFIFHFRNLFLPQQLDGQMVPPGLPRTPSHRAQQHHRQGCLRQDVQEYVSYGRKVRLWLFITEPTQKMAGFEIKAYFIRIIFYEQYLFVHASVCPSICPSVCPSVYPSIRSSIHRSVCLAVHLSISLSVYPSNCILVCLSIRLSVHLSIQPSVCPSVYRSVYPSTYCQSVSFSVCLSFHLSICMSVRLSIFSFSILYLSAHRPVCLHVCLSVSETLYMSTRIPKLSKIGDAKLTRLASTRILVCSDAFLSN
jgi:hypothetical protein